MTAAALAALVVLLDWSAMSSLLRQTSAAAIALAVLLCAATHVLLALRWHVIANSSIPGGFWFHVAAYWRASVFNLLTPAAIGGDVYRVLALKANAVSRGGIAGLVVRERLLGLGAYFASYLAALPFADDPSGFFRSLAPIAACGLAGVLAAWLVLARAGAVLADRLPQKVRPFVGRLTAALRAATGRQLAAAFALTMAACAGWFAVVHVLAVNFGAGAGFSTAALSAVLAELIRILPISVQGIGFREATVGYGYQASGAASFEAGVAAAMIAYILYNLVIALGGVATSLGWVRRAV